MNKRLIAAMLIVAAHAGLAQVTDVDPEPGEKPSRPFSNTIPEGTAWKVTPQHQAEAAAQRESAGADGQDAPPSPAHLVLKRIEHAYAAGTRRETFHYGDGASFTRYVTADAVLYEDRSSGEPISDSPSTSASGPTSGTDRLREFDWVSDRHYLGVADYDGEACYVYRSYASQAPRPPQDEPLDLDEPAETIGTAMSELSDPDAAVIAATAFIAKATMKPVALETAYGVRRYDWSPAFQPFSLPANLTEAERNRAKAIERQKQLYMISQ